MKRLCIVFILLLWTIVSSSQLIWINYENSGHYNDASTTIAFDKQNNPWSGTILNGVRYHNGSSFQNFNTLNSPILHDKIYDLLYDTLENQLYIATLEGLCVLKENVWTGYTTENSNLPSNAILSLAMDKNRRLWIGTDEGVLDGLNGKVFNTGNTILKGELVLDIFIDSKGNKWFATDEEVARFDNKNWQTFSSENTVLPKVSALTVAEDTTGTIWASFGNTYTGTLASFNGETWKIHDKSMLHNLSSRIRSIVALKNGTIWFGTHDKGLIRYKDSEWSAFTTDNSEIPINQIIAMEADHKDNLWIAHRNGLTRVVDEKLVGIKTIFESKLLIVPNPADNFFRIIIPGSSKQEYNLLVRNLNGQMVRFVPNVKSDYLFNRRYLDSGIYLLLLYNSQEIYRGKIIFK